MENRAFINMHSVSTPEDCVLDIEKPLGMAPDVEQMEVCYPYKHDYDTITINKNALSSYINDDSSIPLTSVVEHVSIAKLDDLFDMNDSHSGSRTRSICSDLILGPALVNKELHKYTFYSTELGAIKSQTLKGLLQTNVEKNGQSNAVSNLLLNTTGWWIDILAPSTDEMRTISSIFKIHPLTTEDILAQETREKCDTLGQYTYISFRSYFHDVEDPYNLKSAVFYILLFKDGILTFRFQDLPHSHNVRSRIHRLKDYIDITPEWINYALIDNITDHFAPLIQITEIEADSIDDLVLVLSGTEQNDILRRIGNCRQIVQQLMRLLSPKADVIRSLIKKYEDKAKEAKHSLSFSKDQDKHKLHNDVVLYLGDIQDHILTMLQSVNHCDLVLGRAHSNYLGQASIELAQAGNTTNAVVNRLTYFATIVVPMNLVTGLFGMNVKIPGSQHIDLVWFYWILSGLLIYAVFMFAIGRRSGLV